MNASDVISAAIATAIKVAIGVLTMSKVEVTAKDLDEAKARALLAISALNAEQLSQEAKEWAIVKGQIGQ
jgi:hypothetical protein